MEVEKENRVIETAIDIETKSDEFGRNTQPHNGKKIDRIIVSEYDDSYAVTYSKENNSIQGWSVNIEEDGQQQPGVYLKFDQHNDYDLKLYNKTLLRTYRDDDGK